MPPSVPIPASPGDGDNRLLQKMLANFGDLTSSLETLDARLTVAEQAIVAGMSVGPNGELNVADGDGHWHDTGMTITEFQQLVRDVAANDAALKIGDLSTLTTTDKSNLVNAINEVRAYSSTVNDTKIEMARRQASFKPANLAFPGFAEQVSGFGMPSTDVNTPGNIGTFHFEIDTSVGVRTFSLLSAVAEGTSANGTWGFQYGMSGATPYLFFNFSYGSSGGNSAIQLPTLQSAPGVHYLSLAVGRVASGGFFMGVYLDGQTVVENSNFLFGYITQWRPAARLFSWFNGRPPFNGTPGLTFGNVRRQLLTGSDGTNVLAAHTGFISTIQHGTPPAYTGDSYDWHLDAGSVRSDTISGGTYLVAAQNWPNAAPMLFFPFNTGNLLDTPGPRIPRNFISQASRNVNFAGSDAGDNVATFADYSYPFVYGIPGGSFSPNIRGRLRGAPSSLLLQGETYVADQSVSQVLSTWVLRSFDNAASTQSVTIDLHASL